MNVAKIIGIFGNNNESFMDFTKWKHDKIFKVIYSTYSESDAAQRKSTMNDLITKIIFSERCKVFRVTNNEFSIVMSEKEIRYRFSTNTYYNSR